jgi:hypothetical protein
MSFTKTKNSSDSAGSVEVQREIMSIVKTKLPAKSVELNVCSESCEIQKEREKNA